MYIFNTKISGTIEEKGKAFGRYHGKPQIGRRGKVINHTLQKIRLGVPRLAT